jgi:hypothetical protein
VSVSLCATTPAQLSWGLLVSFKYEGRLIDDGLFICLEDDGLRMRLLFAGPTIGRFDLVKVTELSVIQENA